MKEVSVKFSDSSEDEALRVDICDTNACCHTLCTHQIEVKVIVCVGFGSQHAVLLFSAELSTSALETLEVIGFE